MRFILLFCYCFGLSISQLCPPGSVHLPQENGCAIVQQTGDDSGYFKAEALCQELNGHLISIHNAFANSALVSYARGVNSSTDTLYIGGDDYRNNEFSWIDKINMNYTNWVPGEPSSNGNCMGIRLSDGKWFVTECHATLPFICEIPGLPTSSTVPPTTQYDACPANWTMYKDNCYKLFILNMEIQLLAARYRYLNEGADLPSIHSAEENAFILDLCRSLPQVADYYPWIGLTYNGMYQWSDGTPATYVNVVNEPPEVMPSLYDLASSGANQGKWDDYDANDEDVSAASYMCKRSINLPPRTS